MSGSPSSDAGPRILIAGGGTGGHIIPALAIADELKSQHGAEIVFVGTARGLESRLVPQAGYRLELMRVGQLNNVSLATRVRTLLDLPFGLLRCVALLRRERPAVVIGVGGYASGPIMGAAILLRIPTLAFEPNAVPGLANRLVGRRVKAAAVNFPPAARYFRNAQVTGIPVRAEFFHLAARPADAPPSAVGLVGDFACLEPSSPPQPGRAAIPHGSNAAATAPLIARKRTVFRIAMSSLSRPRPAEGYGGTGTGSSLASAGGTASSPACCCTYMPSV